MNWSWLAFPCPFHVLFRGGPTQRSLRDTLPVAEGIASQTRQWPLLPAESIALTETLTGPAASGSETVLSHWLAGEWARQHWLQTDAPLVVEPPIELPSSDVWMLGRAELVGIAEALAARVSKRKGKPPKP